MYASYASVLCNYISATPKHTIIEISMISTGLPQVVGKWSIVSVKYYTRWWSREIELGMIAFGRATRKQDEWYVSA